MANKSIKLTEIFGLGKKIKKITGRNIEDYGEVIASTQLGAGDEDRGSGTLSGKAKFEIMRLDRMGTMSLRITNDNGEVSEVEILEDHLDDILKVVQKVKSTVDSRR